jgi:hypothetical protein
MRRAIADVELSHARGMLEELNADHPSIDEYRHERRPWELQAERAEEVLRRPREYYTRRQGRCRGDDGDQSETDWDEE